PMRAGAVAGIAQRAVKLLQPLPREELGILDQVARRLELGLEPPTEDRRGEPRVKVDTSRNLLRNVEIWIVERRQAARLVGPRGVRQGQARPDERAVRVVREIGRLIAEVEDQIAERIDFAFYRDVPIIDGERQVRDMPRDGEYSTKSVGLRLLRLEDTPTTARGNLNATAVRRERQCTRGAEDRRQLFKAIVVDGIAWRQGRPEVRTWVEAVFRIEADLGGDELLIEVRRTEVGSVVAAEADRLDRRPLGVEVI